MYIFYFMLNHLDTTPYFTVKEIRHNPINRVLNCENKVAEKLLSRIDFSVSELIQKFAQFPSRPKALLVAYLNPFELSFCFIFSFLS